MQISNNNNIEELVTYTNGKINVPDHPVIPVIPGDGIGAEVWEATRKIVDLAIKIAYKGTRKIQWKNLLAGEKAFDQTGEWLPEETLQAFQKYIVGIKGPLTTPVSGGIRSLNVALRKLLDLYVCLRPVRWFSGIPAPVLRPENVDISIFRENTEDLYTGIEFSAGSEQSKQLLSFIKQSFPEEASKIRFTDEVGLGIKPISKEGSERLVRAAINYALLNGKHTLTLVHKGNIMKFTEGAFRIWGYDLVESEYADQVYTGRQWSQTKSKSGESAANHEKDLARKSGKLWVNDMITDAAFQQVLLYPSEFDVIATTNLNGDYISDALAAQVGGLGIAPGANLNYQSGVAIFEATHGTAPTIAGKNQANPSSLILSAEMMLRYIGWNESANLIISAFEKTISACQFTSDLAQFVNGSTLVSTTEFSDVICSKMLST